MMIHCFTEDDNSSGVSIPLDERRTLLILYQEHLLICIWLYAILVACEKRAVLRNHTFKCSLLRVPNVVTKISKEKNYNRQKMGLANQFPQVII